MIVLATTAPDTIAVVMSCALRDSVAPEIQDISASKSRMEWNHPISVIQPSMDEYESATQKNLVWYPPV